MSAEYVSKVVYDGTTLIDISQDTVDAAHLLEGYTAHGSDGAAISGSCSYDADTSDATASAGEILAGETAYVNGSKVTGSMTNNEDDDVIVTGKSGTTIPAGYYDGSGKAKIDSTSASNLEATNIRKDITILGVTGSMTGTEDVVAESPEVTPSSSQQVVAPGQGYNYLAQVTVKAIPYTSAVNAGGGLTVTIG